MTSHSKSTAHNVHELLLEAHPHVDDGNLLKAAHAAESTGQPHDHLQLETFVAIRNLRTAIERGASAAEAESLLLHAIDVAETWARESRSANG